MGHDSSVWHVASGSCRAGLSLAVAAALAVAPISAQDRPQATTSGQSLTGSQEQNGSQEQTGSQEQNGDRQQNGQGDKAPQKPAAAKQLRYARVKMPALSLRCFATDRSPFFEDRLQQDDVVQVAEAKGKFMRVSLPLGALGYVHERFCTEVDDGVVRTKRPRVSFRYRPRSGEAPVTVLNKDTKLVFLSSKDQWHKVRFQQARCYVPAEAIELLPEPLTDTARDRHQALIGRYQESWTKAKDGWSRRQEQDRELAGLSKRLTQLRQRFAKITGTQDDAQQQKVALDKLHDEVVVLQKELASRVAIDKAATKAKGQQEPGKTKPAEASAAAAKVDGSAQQQRLRRLDREARLLAVDVQTQERLAAAVVAVQRRPKPAKDVDVSLPSQPGPTHSERFDAVGWLRFDPEASSRARTRLEKGGKLVAYLISSRSRYDFRLFDGVEVAVRGKTSPIERGVIPVIDASELEVIALGKR